MPRPHRDDGRARPCGARGRLGELPRGEFPVFGVDDLLDETGKVGREADELLGRVAEQALDRRGDVPDAPVGPRDGHEVRRTLDVPGEPILSPTRRPLGPPTTGISGHAERPDHGALPVPKRGVRALENRPGHLHDGYELLPRERPANVIRDPRGSPVHVEDRPADYLPDLEPKSLQPRPAGERKNALAIDREQDCIVSMCSSTPDGHVSPPTRSSPFPLV